MRRTISSTGAGRAVAQTAIQDGLLVPDKPVAGLPPLLYCHGAADADPSEMITWPSRRLVRSLVQLGFSAMTVVTTHSWGNSVARGRMDAAATYLRDNYGAVGAPVVIGASEGASDSLNYAFINGALAVIGIIPAVDLDDIRNNDINGFRSQIDSAWGVTYPDPLPVNASPHTHPKDFTGIPIQFWVASDDTIASASSANNFAVGVGAENYDLGALGHTGAAMDAVDADALVSFVLDNV